LYRYVLKQDIESPSIHVRAQKSDNLPVVLTHQEAMSVIRNMTGIPQLMAKVLYGSGLRLTECLRLRVKDIDFGNHQILVWDGKGENDRSTILSNSLIPLLEIHLKTVKAIHAKDLKDGFGETSLPYALSKKYPNAAHEWLWQYVFPASVRSMDPMSKKIKKHHLDASVLQKSN